MDLADDFVISAKVRMWKLGERIKGFLKEEQGVSNVVATVILVLIVVLLIAAFWESLSKWLKTIMEQIFGQKYEKPDLGSPT